MLLFLSVAGFCFLDVRREVFRALYTGTRTYLQLRESTKANGAWRLAGGMREVNRQDYKPSSILR